MTGRRDPEQKSPGAKPGQHASEGGAEAWAYGVVVAGAGVDGVEAGGVAAGGVAAGAGVDGVEGAVVLPEGAGVAGVMVEGVVVVLGVLGVGLLPDGPELDGAVVVTDGDVLVVGDVERPAKTKYAMIIKAATIMAPIIQPADVLALRV
ncbi:MAG TPA: hypothetical protein VL418_02865 [Devosiaceae bacterium]|nr:hypothetical protein [Devosiaceae bacterium]